MKVAVLLGAVCIFQQFGNGFGANPNYSFHVKVDDPGHSNFREKAETRKLEDTQGFYRSSFGNKVSTGSVQVSYAFGNHVPLAVPPANGGPSVVGVYAPAYVFDSRGQLVDKSVIAAPPPVLNVNALQLPGPAVVVPQPLRQVAPVIKASAALTTNYAPAYVPPPQAFAPLQVAAPPQVVSYVPPPPPPPPPAQVFAYAPAPPPPPPAQVFAYAPPPPQFQVQVQPAPIAVAKVRPAKYLTVPALAPAVKVVKARPVAIVKDSYAEPPKDTFRDPNAPSYPESVKIREPTLEYGPPSYVPPPPLVEEQVKVFAQPPPVKVVQQQVAVALPPPPPPPQAIAVQKVVAAPPPPPQPVLGLYAGAIGFHTHTAQPDAYLHSYGTQGFQVHTSRKFNKAVLAQPVYGPPPAIAVQKVQAPTYLPPPPPAVAVQPAPLYGPPPVRVVQPKPVYGPPPAINFVQQAAVAVAPPPPPPPPAPVVQYIQSAPPPPPPAPVVQYIQSAPPPPPPPPPAPIAVSAPILQQAAPAPPSLAFTGKKQNPLVFSYSYDQGAAKVTHSYAGSGW